MTRAGGPRLIGSRALVRVLAAGAACLLIAQACAHSDADAPTAGRLSPAVRNAKAYVYVPSNDDGSVTVIDQATMAVIDHFHAGRRSRPRTRCAARAEPGARARRGRPAAAGSVRVRRG